MRHDAYAGRVLVDQDVIGLSVRAVREEIRLFVLVVAAHPERQEPGDDRLYEPLREGFVEERVLDEFGRPGLKTTVGQLLPSRLRRIRDLIRRLDVSAGHEALDTG